MRTTLGIKMFKGMSHGSKSPHPLSIEFICDEERLDFVAKPIPAVTLLPQWYKDLHPYVGGKKEYTEGTSGTIKKCMPVFDAMSAGYLILFPCDVHVSRNLDGSPAFKWPIEYKLVNEHSKDQASTLKIPEDKAPQLLKWSNPWRIKVPEGWSVLFTQPMHRDDLPFTILPGIVDADQFKLSVQFPFLLDKGFEGVIPAGTPMAQVIPIKREEWRASYSSVTVNASQKNLQEHSIYFENRYKRTFWNRKVYK